MIIKIKHIDNIKKEMGEYGYYLVDNEYKGNKLRYNFIDVEGYKYFCLIQTIRNGSKPRNISKHNPFSIENIKLWCKLNNKHFELNNDIFIDVIEKLEWKCLNENCQQLFYTEWHAISSNDSGCPYCSGHKVSSNNCLSKVFPEVASEWHPTRNGNLTPNDITKGSPKKVWWKCSINLEHEWEAKIQNRTINKTGCPYCFGRIPTVDNNLLIRTPELAKEWDYTKNKKKPTDVLPGSNEKAWWICQEGHGWEASIRNRGIINRGCPYCNESKGEKRIRKWLEENNMIFESQKEFNGLVGNGGGLLSYDFNLPKQNILIEYQGEFHDGSSGAYSRINLEIQKEHDKRKREYAEQNNIELLEIWYYDFDNIEKILNKELKGR